MILFPDPTTVFEDPFTKVPTLVLICDVGDPVTERPTRGILDMWRARRKTTSNPLESATRPTWVRSPNSLFLTTSAFDQTYNHGFYYIDSVEGHWNTGREENPNLGYKPRYKEGYFPVPPMDSLQDVRTEMMLTLIESGIDAEVHHHEVATGGQCEIDLRFDSLLNMADKFLKFKYIVKNVARRYGKTVTFMPKPIFMDNGSGMHCHQSVWKEGPERVLSGRNLRRSE